MAAEPIRSMGSEDMQRLINQAGGQAIHPEDMKTLAAETPEVINTSADRTTGRGQSGTGNTAGGNQGSTAGGGST